MHVVAEEGVVEIADILANHAAKLDVRDKVCQQRPTARHSSESLHKPVAVLSRPPPGDWYRTGASAPGARRPAGRTGACASRRVRSAS